MEARQRRERRHQLRLERERLHNEEEVLAIDVDVRHRPERRHQLRLDLERLHSEEVVSSK